MYWTLTLQLKIKQLSVKIYTMNWLITKTTGSKTKEKQKLPAAI